MRPPEVNSGRMYCGPGSELMTTAATAWDTLAAHLGEMAAGHASATARRAEGSPDPADYLEWLTTLAAVARQTATQARRAVSAYEAAFAATVPPREVEANRAHRACLAATNFLGQASTDIAATEADYERMWAQDAGAMYAYAAASADAATLTPFPPPPVAPAGHDAAVPHKKLRNWRVEVAPEVVSCARHVTSTIPAALKKNSAAPLTTVEAFLLPVTASLSKLSSLSAPLDCAIKHLNSLNKAASLRQLLPECHADATVAAGVGRGASVGELTVPRAWPTATATTVDTEQPPHRGWVGEQIRLVATTEPPPQPSERRPS